NRNSSQAKTDFLDGSDTLFSMYNEKACEFDSKLIRDWKEDADGLILLSGLVSASVAAFLSQSFFQSQGDSSSNVSSDGNSLPVALETVSSTFTILSQLAWFTSLMMSLGCAVGATLAQGFVRQYLLLTQLQSTGSPHWSARIRVCMTQYGFPEFVSRFLKFLNLLLHTSIYLFLGGLLFLAISSSNALTITVVTVSFILSLMAYLGFTWRWKVSLRFLFVSPLSLFRRHDLGFRPSTGWQKLLRATTQEIVKHISTRTTTLDAGAVSWLINSLTHDQELQRFITGIPGFYNSTQVEEPAQVLRDVNSDTIPKAIVALMNHSLSSDLVSDTTRQQRVTVSLKAMQTDPYLLQRTFFHTLCSTESAIFNSLTFVLLADQYADDEDPNIRSLARCIVAITINHREGYHSDGRWAGIIQRRLDWSRALFALYYGQHDSVKLRNLVRLAWELYFTHPGSGSPSPEIIHNSLHVARQLNVEATAPELRHEFCDLWNWLVAALQGWPEHPTLRSNVMLILSSIHPIFVPLHQNTESQSSALSSSTSDLGLRDPSYYPQCTVASHRPSTLVSLNANTLSPMVPEVP
ncbi:hypothetical protein BJY52DRAFT_1311730, partial [Lactarius psammicola]